MLSQECLSTLRDDLKCFPAQKILKFFFLEPCSRHRGCQGTERPYSVRIPFFRLADGTLSQSSVTQFEKCR